MKLGKLAVWAAGTGSKTAAMIDSPRSPWISRPSDHLSYRVMSLGSLGTVFLGFARTYYLKEFFETSPHRFSSTYHRIHRLAIVFRCTDQSDCSPAHRRSSSYGLPRRRACGCKGGGRILASVASARLGRGAGAVTHDPIEAVFSDMEDIVVFLTFLIPGFWYRRNSETHKRLMLLATTAGLLPAALARWPFLHHLG
jgi:hypothetical protein